MKYKAALMKIGMKDDEAIVYETLLEEGESNILNLSYKTNINRPALYILIPKMIKKDLIVEIKKNKRILYSAVSPDKLDTLVKNSQKDLENIINNLNTEYSKKNIIPKIEVYYGEDGIKRIFLDILTSVKKESEILRYSSVLEFKKDYRPKDFGKNLRDKKVETLVITNTEIKEKNDIKNNLYTMVKTLDNYINVNNVSKTIYENKIAHIDYENEVGFIMYNEKITKMEKEIFMSLWRKI
ncbi:MAG: helix-turn-helix domain-containing protein [Candidatus Nomurabacteria bacterium]